MQISTKQLTELKPYANNPRKNDRAVDAVAASIREFGFKVPLVIDKDGVIVAGHTRYKAAQKLGLKELPCIVADDLTDDQIKAFRLADNKTAELAEWDFELLDLELDDIELDMSEFGFMEIPKVLDAAEDYSADEPLACKLTFDNYKTYKDREDAVKEFAENIGAVFSVVKA